MRLIIILSLLISTSSITASTVNQCEDTPKDAIMELPIPLSEWGKIICTPYGHIISSKEGWIWSNPGNYKPVIIPSQMVKSNPKKLDNKSYFKKIVWKQLQSKEAELAIQVFEQGFDHSSIRPNVYSMKVISISGKELGFQFFEFENNHWGIWCNNECNPNSRFMILNMKKSLNVSKVNS